MANTYANLGGTIGDILGRATNARTSSPQGYSAGVNAGSQHMLRSAQSNKAMADTDQIMYALDQARKGDATTGQQLAAGMGVDPGAYDAMSVPGATTMPAIPGAAGPSQPVAIPQAMRDKFNNANTTKIMSQLMGGTSAGGTVDTAMAALLKGQELGTRSNLQSGAQLPGAVAEAEAALLGKYPGQTGAGGGKASADIQMFNLLTSKRGGGLSAEEAVKQVLGANADVKAFDALMESLVRSGQYEVEEMTAMLPELIEARKKMTNPGYVAPPPNVVKEY